MVEEVHPANDSQLIRHFGAKDEAIAAISLRTVTRIVAELKGELGTGSRFQAGVLTARLGWLD